MIDLEFERVIGAPAERVFSLLSQLRNYNEWLPPSSAFHGTVSISEGPISVGTTYVEPGPFGTRNGVVTEMERPTRLSFEQPMTMKPSWLGVIGIKLSHLLTPKADAVHLLRVLRLSAIGPVGLAMPVVTRFFRTENVRMLKTLKSYAEAHP